MTCSSSCDLLIVGAGPAGYSAALDAAKLGLKVIVAERMQPGGTCVNMGCVPTKLLLGASAPLAALKALKKQKIMDGEIAVDLEAVQKRNMKLVAGTRNAIVKQLQDAGVEIIRGRATLSGSHSVTVPAGECPDELDAKCCVTEADTSAVGMRTVTFRYMLLCNGSVPAALPGLEADGRRVVNSNWLLTQRKAPEDMIILGGGVIGLELGDFFAQLGTKITMVEALDRIAPLEDPEISETLFKIRKREGWKIICGRRVQSLTTDGDSARLVFEDGEELRASLALTAVGRTPATAGMCLEEHGVELVGRGWVKTDDCLRTTLPHIYAAGDVNGRMLLAHTAWHQSRWCVRHIAAVEKGNAESMDPYRLDTMISCIYGSTEVMRAGKSVAELCGEGRDVAVSSAPLAANCIAQSHGASQGFVKVIWSSGRVQGITAVGHGTSHLVTQAAIIAGQQWDDSQIDSLLFAHPTLDETLEAALTAPRTTVAGDNHPERV